MLEFMLTWRNANSSIWNENNPLELEPYRVNLALAMGMMQVESKYCIIKGERVPFKSPLVRIDFAVSDGEGDCLSAYVSGVLDEVEARFRQGQGK